MIRCILKIADLQPGRFYYVVVALDEQGLITDRYQSISVDVERVTTRAEALERGLITESDAVQIGDKIALAWHPLGTDYLAGIYRRA